MPQQNQEQTQEQVTKQEQTQQFPTFNKPDLSTLSHDDKCRYHDDEEFCTCGADTYEELKAYKTAYKELETALQKLQTEQEQLKELNKKYKQALEKIADEVPETFYNSYDYSWTPCDTCRYVVDTAQAALYT